MRCLFSGDLEGSDGVEAAESNAEMPSGRRSARALLVGGPGCRAGGGGRRAPALLPVQAGVVCRRALTFRVDFVGLRLAPAPRRSASARWLGPSMTGIRSAFSPLPLGGGRGLVFRVASEAGSAAEGGRRGRAWAWPGCCCFSGGDSRYCKWAISPLSVGPSRLRDDIFHNRAAWLLEGYRRRDYRMMGSLFVRQRRVLLLLIQDCGVGIRGRVL